MSFIPPIVGETPLQRLQSLRSALAGRIVFTTSFGIEDQALAHFIFTESLEIDVVTLDTGRLPPPTYKVWQETEERYGHRIRSYHPDPGSLSAMIADSGVNGFYHSRAARLDCCRVRKVEPLGRALDGAQAWVAGLRADQSSERSELKLVAWDEGYQLIKLAPLVDWSREAVTDFCAAQNVPINSLHAQGFPSIGCEPCTRAIKPGEPERAGRWWWETNGSSECGLHTTADGRRARKAA